MASSRSRFRNSLAPPFYILHQRCYLLRMAYIGEEKSRYEKQRREHRRRWAIALLGGCCVVCKSKDSLEFHHVRGQKKFNVAAGLGKSESTLLVEVMKCELRCIDHHKEKHAAKHGTASKYRAGCRCFLCVSEQRIRKRLWTKEWRARGADKSRPPSQTPYRSRPNAWK